MQISFNLSLFKKARSSTVETSRYLLTFHYTKHAVETCRFALVLFCGILSLEKCQLEGMKTNVVFTFEKYLKC